MRRWLRPLNFTPGLRAVEFFFLRRGGTHVPAKGGKPKKPHPVFLPIGSMESMGLVYFPTFGWWILWVAAIRVEIFTEIANENWRQPPAAAIILSIPQPCARIFSHIGICLFQIHWVMARVGGEFHTKWNWDVVISMIFNDVSCIRESRNISDINFRWVKFETVYLSIPSYVASTWTYMVSFNFNLFKDSPIHVGLSL